MIFAQVNLSVFAREDYMMFSAFKNQRFSIRIRGLAVRGFYFVSFRSDKFRFTKIRYGYFNVCSRFVDFVAASIFAVNGIVFAVYFFNLSSNTGDKIARLNPLAVSS